MEKVLLHDLNQFFCVHLCFGCHQTFSRFHTVISDVLRIHTPRVAAHCFQSLVTTVTFLRNESSSSNVQYVSGGQGDLVQTSYLGRNLPSIIWDSPRPQSPPFCDSDVVAHYNLWSLIVNVRLSALVTQTTLLKGQPQRQAREQPGCLQGNGGWFPSACNCRGSRVYQDDTQR